MLEREGYTRSAANGKRRLFWVRREYPGFRDATIPPVQKEVLDLLEEHGRMSRKELLSKVGISRSTLHFNVKQMVMRGMIHEEKQGKEKFCYLE